MQQVEKATGKTPEELIGPDFPVEVSWIWETFLDVHRGRSYGMSGPNPITWEGIQAWCNLNGIVLSSWELKTVLDLDATWVRIAHEDKNG